MYLYSFISCIIKSINACSTNFVIVLIKEMVKVLLGHKDEEKEQSLIHHLFNVAESASNNATAINQSHTCYLLGLFHDLGKADRLFQEKIKNNSKMKVNHSSAGAKYFLEFIQSNASITKKISSEHHTLFFEYIEIIIYIITSHHGIYDIWKTTSNSNQMDLRIRYDEIKKYHYNEDVVQFGTELQTELHRRRAINLEKLILISFEEFILLNNKLNPMDDKERAFYTGLKIRLLLSLLKNADIEDTVNAYDKLITPFDKNTLSNKKKNYLEEVEKIYRDFSTPTTAINKIRNRLGKEGLARGQKDEPGIYQLNLPTGAGKTLISLRYGMHQLNKKEKERFIYITPFLSVLEQNAKEIKLILNDSDILEHHSNIINNETLNEESQDSDREKEDLFTEYLIDTWNSPVVLSTMVQFFQTLFKGKSSNIRRFSSLTNAVIILDEVQSLPVTVTTLFNLTMNFLSQVMACTVVLCTATQPTYDSPYIKHKMQYSMSEQSDSNIVTLTDTERKVFERTMVHKFNGNEVSTLEDIIRNINSYPNESILIILNTKHAVREVYDSLAGISLRQIYYLSTNLCPKHRQTIIENMKKKLTNNEPIICISTPLIEAGVDIDFDCLIRSYSGVDSIIQAMGRCNRHGKNKQKGMVNLIKINKQLENIDRIEEVKDKASVTEYILKRSTSPVDVISLNNAFYERYYANNQSKMDFPLSIKNHPSAFDYLSTNTSMYDLSLQRKSFFKVLNQSFNTAASHIDLIKNDTSGVIVYYEESIKWINELIPLLEEYETTFNFQLLISIKKYTELLQPYTVNMHLNFDSKKAVTPYLNGNINILTQDFYDIEKGVLEEAESLIM